LLLKKFVKYVHINAREKVNANMKQYLLTASAILLLVFSNLSIFDGLYYHLWKFKLQERVDSRLEHVTHTVRALLFIPMMALIYLVGAQGRALWFTAFIVLLDLLVEVIDVLNEKRSRQDIGGLSSGEYLLHVVLTTLRASALALAFASYPRDAWVFGSHAARVVPPFSKWVAVNLLPGAVAISSFHVLLFFKPMLVTQMEHFLKSKCCPDKLLA
jgi:hypothetical protein